MGCGLRGLHLTGGYPCAASSADVCPGFVTLEFPKNKEYHFRCPIIRITAFLGSVLVSPYLGKLPGASVGRKTPGLIVLASHRFCCEAVQDTKALNYLVGFRCRGFVVIGRCV